MGGIMVIPDTDDRMEKLVHFFALTDMDLGQFYKIYCKLG